jgi:hypothetical protein
MSVKVKLKSRNRSRFEDWSYFYAFETPPADVQIYYTKSKRPYVAVYRDIGNYPVTRNLIDFEEDYQFNERMKIDALTRDALEAKKPIEKLLGRRDESKSANEWVGLNNKAHELITDWNKDFEEIITAIVL